MDLSLEIKELLEFTSQPSFCVNNGLVLEANPAAQNRGIQLRMPIEDLLRSGREEYADFQDGQLFLTVGIGESVWDASVRKIDSVHIFVLEHDEQQTELRAFALAGSQMRNPLSNAISSLDELQKLIASNDPNVRELEAILSKSLYQLQRLTGNMTDASRYRNESSVHLETAEIRGFLQEIFDKAAAHLDSSHVQLTFEAQCGSIYCLIDKEKLERTVFNILSNAATFAPGGKIQAKLLHKGNRLYLSITDNGSGIPSRLYSSVYTRYMRQPEPEDSRLGIGLGLSLVCSTARAMKGTVLLQQPEDGGTKITLAFPIRQSKGVLKSNVLKPDYAGERDHALLELSNTLPHSIYEY